MPSARRTAARKVFGDKFVYIRQAGLVVPPAYKYSEETSGGWAGDNKGND